MNDNVNRPSHYSNSSLECIETMQIAYSNTEVVSFCMLNAFKYLWRCKYKNGKEDLEKCQWYITKGKSLATESYYRDRFTSLQLILDQKKLEVI